MPPPTRFVAHAIPCSIACVAIGLAAATVSFAPPASADGPGFFRGSYHARLHGLTRATPLPASDPRPSSDPAIHAPTHPFVHHTPYRTASHDPFYRTCQTPRYAIVGGSYATAPPVYFTQPIVVTSTPVAQAAMPGPAPHPEPPTLLERARWAAAASDAHTAAYLLREHLRTDPHDSAAACLLGWMLMEQGHLQDGVSLVRLQLATDPDAVLRDPGTAWLGPRRTRALLQQAVAAGNRTRSISPLLAAGVLAHAEGRPGVTLRLVQRCRALGLGPAEAAALEQCLAPSLTLGP